jgi:ferredoxin
MSTVNITVKGEGTFSVPESKRLVLALVDECGIDQMHACGGNCMCTTCAVSFVEGEPAVTTAAEQAKLAERGLSGVRLSCQIQAAEGMQVEILNRLEGTGRSDPGSRPSDDITPEPEWVNL